MNERELKVARKALAADLRKYTVRVDLDQLCSGQVIITDLTANNLTLWEIAKKNSILVRYTSGHIADRLSTKHQQEGSLCRRTLQAVLAITAKQYTWLFEKKQRDKYLKLFANGRNFLLIFTVPDSIWDHNPALRRITGQHVALFSSLLTTATATGLYFWQKNKEFQLVATEPDIPGARVQEYLALASYLKQKNWQNEDILHLFGNYSGQFVGRETKDVLHILAGELNEDEQKQPDPVRGWLAETILLMAETRTLILPFLDSTVRYLTNDPYAPQEIRFWILYNAMKSIKPSFITDTAQFFELMKFLLPALIAFTEHQIQEQRQINDKKTINADVAQYMQLWTASLNVHCTFVDLIKAISHRRREGENREFSLCVNRELNFNTETVFNVIQTEEVPNYYSSLIMMLYMFAGVQSNLADLQASPQALYPAVILKQYFRLLPLKVVQEHFSQTTVQLSLERLGGYFDFYQKTTEALFITQFPNLAKELKENEIFTLGQQCKTYVGVHCTCSLCPSKPNLQRVLDTVKVQERMPFKRYALKLLDQDFWPCSLVNDILNPDKSKEALEEAVKTLKRELNIR